VNPDLSTTNVLLAIMAAVKLMVLASAAGAALAGFFVFRRLRRLADRTTERHVVPLAARIKGILDDLGETRSSAGAGAWRVGRSFLRLVQRRQ
jgi:hypothetical protein